MKTTPNKKTETFATEVANRAFGKRAVKALAKKGVEFIGTCVIPGDGPLPYANGETGYQISDNGTGRVLGFLEVLALVK